MSASVAEMAQSTPQSPSYSVLVEGVDPWRRSQVKVVLDPEFSRREHPDKRLRDSVQELWETRLAENPMLFNATKFRMESANIVDNGELEIHCSVTDYASYLGTNWNPLFHGEDRVYMADPLGVGCLLTTADKMLCFIRRSKHVGEYPEYLDAPGGHPEPNRVPGCGDSRWTHDTEKPSLPKYEGGNVASCDGMSDGGTSSDLIVEEFFESIVQEVKDECGVPKSSLSDISLMGIIRQMGGSKGRPSLVFKVSCCLTSEQIKELYPSASEAFETTSLEFRSIDSALSKLQDEDAIQMTPGCIACIEMWQRFMALQ